VVVSSPRLLSFDIGAGDQHRLRRSFNPQAINLTTPAGGGIVWNATAQDTRAFRTPDASGSTSQATNIQEALELGCSSLIIDEDTAATNFMIRDARMQTLVAKEKEPITPFISKVMSRRRVQICGRKYTTHRNRSRRTGG
jgi:hypothetical protein